jgi:hypothetical protein
MAAANSRAGASTRQPTSRKRLQCADCGDTLHYFEDYYCPSCTTFTLPTPRPKVEVGVAFESAGELLERLAGAGWDVEVRGGTAYLYHPWVRTAREACRLLERHGFDPELFSISV